MCEGAVRMTPQALYDAMGLPSDFPVETEGKNKRRAWIQAMSHNTDIEDLTSSFPEAVKEGKL